MKRRRKEAGSFKRYKDLVGQDTELQDVEFKGPIFTWSDSQVHKKLDRCLVSDDWSHKFHNALVEVLIRSSLVTLITLLKRRSRGKSFG